jgi:hypothetical protein
MSVQKSIYTVKQIEVNATAKLLLLVPEYTSAVDIDAVIALHQLTGTFDH